MDVSNTTWEQARVRVAEYTLCSIVLAAKITVSRVYVVEGCESKTQIILKTYDIGESWSIGGKCMILDISPFFFAMSMNSLIGFADSPRGRATLSFE